MHLKTTRMNWCTKSYPSASRLKEHSKVHDPTTSNFQCKYKCGKVFPEKRTVSSMRSTAPGDLSSVRSSVPTVPKRSKGSQISRDMQRNIMQAGIWWQMLFSLKYQIWIMEIMETMAMETTAMETTSRLSQPQWMLLSTQWTLLSTQWCFIWLDGRYPVFSDF